jgi:hypothetical protein
VIANSVVYYYYKFTSIGKKKNYLFVTWYNKYNWVMSRINFIKNTNLLYWVEDSNCKLLTLLEETIL